MWFKNQQTTVIRFTGKPRNGALQSAGMAKSAYISRILDAELGELVRSVPAIVLEGPKGVGKTESVRRLAKTVRRLDVPAERSDE